MYYHFLSFRNQSYFVMIPLIFSMFSDQRLWFFVYQAHVMFLKWYHISTVMLQKPDLQNKLEEQYSKADDLWIRCSKVLHIFTCKPWRLDEEDASFLVYILSNRISFICADLRTMTYKACDLCIFFGLRQMDCQLLICSWLPDGYCFLS